MPHRFVAALALACLIAMPSEAKPRDPVGSFFAGIGKAFEPQKVRKVARKAKPTKVAPARFIAKAEKPKGMVITTIPSIPEITVRPEPKDLDRYAPSGSAITGMASWYGPGFHGRTTACGAITDAAGNKFTSAFNEWRMTAAHKTLRCGTQVQVFRDGYAPIIVTITDRGPFIPGRIIDLSRKAATDLGMMQSGVAKVTLRVLGKD